MCRAGITGRVVTRMRASRLPQRPRNPLEGFCRISQVISARPQPSLSSAKESASSTVLPVASMISAIQIASFATGPSLRYIHHCWMICTTFIVTQ